MGNVYRLDSAGTLNSWKWKLIRNPQVLYGDRKHYKVMIEIQGILILWKGEFASVLLYAMQSYKYSHYMLILERGLY